MMNCQECGNQAKRDCVNMRCRTCCQSRAFYCPTHVKSTWVPAAKRRERQQLQQQQQQQPNISFLQQQQQQQPAFSLMTRSDQQQQQQQQSAFNLMIRTEHVPKRQREHGPQVEGNKFPAEVTSEALFRCVRVNNMDDTEEQLAYQTSVVIGGHLFRGILYDQGPDTTSTSTSTATASSSHQPPRFTTTTNPTPTLFDPTSVSYSAFMSGSPFFPPPRP